MLEKFVIKMKIGRLSFKIRSMENDILRYRQDMRILNDLYYCGRGDIDKFINDWSNVVYFRIAACNRLMSRFERQLDRLNGVVGA